MFQFKAFIRTKFSSQKKTQHLFFIINFTLPPSSSIHSSLLQHQICVYEFPTLIEKESPKKKKRKKSPKNRGMALKAVVYPQTQDPFGYGMNKDFYNYNNFHAGAGNWIYEDLNNLEREEDQQEGSINFLENQTENNNNKKYPYGDWNKKNSNNNSSSSTSMLLIPPPHHQHLSSDNNLLSAESNDLSNNQNFDSSNSTTVASHRPKRRRAKSKKNKEQIENQRMTHIAVERNRRKQMNEYLSLLRSLMPDSYVQRGDQASIIGGAINFVKELEQRMQFLGSHQKKSDIGGSRAFCEFFTFPQYSSATTSANSTAGCDIINSSSVGIGEHEVHPGIADIEVTMVESHANLKIRSNKRPKQLLKIVSALHNMRFTILHLNVTTTREIVLYSLSVKVEDDCKLGSVDDIAGAVYQLMDRIQQEAMLN